MPQQDGQSSFLPWESEGAEWIGQKGAGYETETMRTVSSNKEVGKATISSNNEETEAPRLRKDRVERRHRPVGTTADRAAEATKESMWARDWGSGSVPGGQLCKHAYLGCHKIFSNWPTCILKGTLPLAPYFSNFSEDLPFASRCMLHRKTL